MIIDDSHLISAVPYITHPQILTHFYFQLNRGFVHCLHAAVNMAYFDYPLGEAERGYKSYLAIRISFPVSPV
jgi:hypothetical protein